MTQTDLRVKITDILRKLVYTKRYILRYICKIYIELLIAVQSRSVNHFHYICYIKFMYKEKEGKITTLKLVDFF